MTDRELSARCRLEHLRTAGRGRKGRALDQLSNDGLAYSIVSYGELSEGIAAAPFPVSEALQINRFLEPFSRRPIEVQTALIFGTLRTDLRQRGLRIPDMDPLIVATALQYDLTLLTRNVRHFSRVPDLRWVLPR